MTNEEGNEELLNMANEFDFWGNGDRSKSNFLRKLVEQRRPARPSLEDIAEVLASHDQDVDAVGGWGGECTCGIKCESLREHTDHRAAAVRSLFSDTPQAE